MCPRGLTSGASPCRIYHKNATSSNTTAADGVRYMPSGLSAGKVRSGPRSTLQVVSVRGVELVRPANTGALRCCWYQSWAQNGSCWNRCTWLKRSAGWLPAYSTRALSGPCIYAKPPLQVGCTPWALASAICACVRPRTPPVPGQVSLLTKTVPPLSPVYSGTSVTSGQLLYSSRRARESVTCQPKCQMAVCGDVAGGVATLVNRIRTSFGDWSAGSPPQLAFAVLGNCLV